jgi:hypothetical protein
MKAKIINIERDILESLYRMNDDVEVRETRFLTIFCWQIFNFEYLMKSYRAFNLINDILLAFPMKPKIYVLLHFSTILF